MDGCTSGEGRLARLELTDSVNFPFLILTLEAQIKKRKKILTTHRNYQGGGENDKKLRTLYVANHQGLNLNQAN